MKNNIKLIFSILSVVHSASAIITMQVAGGSRSQYTSIDECVHAAQMIPLLKKFIVIENEIFTPDKIGVLYSLENASVRIQDDTVLIQFNTCYQSFKFEGYN